MRGSIYLVTAVLVVLGLLGACAPAAPTVAPTKPAAVPGGPTAAPVPAAPTIAPKPPAPTPTAAPKVNRGGTLRVAVQNEWNNMWGTLSTGPTPYMLYDTIVYWQPDAKGLWGPQPALAESWDIQGKEITFKLRKGVKFHDGTDWNAEAARWNLEQQATLKKSVALVVTDQLDPKGFQVVDDYTLKVTLKYPSASFLTGISDAQVYGLIVSKAAIDKLGEDKYQDGPVGTGPFQFVEWKRNDHLTVKRNPNYWRKGDDGQPLPYLDGINYRFIVDDSVRLLELKSGNIDFIEFVQGKDVPSVKASPDLSFMEVDWLVLARNMLFNSQREPWGTNKKLRQAALYAIDREALAKTLGLGIGRPAKYLLAPGTLGYDESVPYYWYDLNKAKQLMKEAGYPDGVDLDITVHSREIDQRQAQMLQQMFASAGIRANLTIVERLAWVQRVREGNQFEAATRQGNSGADPDIEMTTLWRAEGRAAYTRYKNPELEKCLDDGRSEYDVKKRHEIYKRCQTISYEDAFWAWLWDQTYNYAMSSKLKGFPPAWAGNWRHDVVWLER
ncbi:MAG: ABC transporter substrate-binding protein [Bacteroidetes bacterium]|nr:ABC transporter substrate-binding protein [Bacteroidota bacterium]MCL5026132.1 ABC transporter substrate-binding protein [Chloroflexota bacterium]